ncbi:hypothetical protein BH11PAT2_BH11PAT2_04610 [soil metagenome]
MALYASSNTTLSSKASFSTHLNYVKYLESTLLACTLSAVPTGMNQRKVADMERFRKLSNLTLKSVKKDIELAREDAAFAVIAAPWFPVKCYYTLYYLESILCHLIDGSTGGFGKGGHGSIRKRIASLVSSGHLVFSSPELNTIYGLAEIKKLPSLQPGLNTRSDFWKNASCSHSLAKKLMEYKLADARLANKWNLHTKKHRDAQNALISTDSLMLPDFFFWYRIKANYKDIDYIDFENGISEAEVLEYLEAYHRAFSHYTTLLQEQIKILR